MKNICSSLTGDKMTYCQLLLDDVFTETLLRLPVRSLVRLRCVAKSWCDLIRSPSFADKHILKPRRNDTMLLVRRYLPRPDDKDVFSFHDIMSPDLEQVGQNLPISFSKSLNCREDGSYIANKFNLVGPCNGLLCIFKYDSIIFCNPALHEFKQIPPCPFTCAKGYGNEIVAEGFGCSGSNDFKVILIRRIMSRTKYDPGTYNIAHLYNSNTNSWKNIHGDAIMVDDVCYYPSSELLLNCVYHWHGTFSDYSCPKIILTFDVSTETFGQLGYPSYGFEELREKSLSFTAINNCLATLLYHRWMIEPQLVDIWVMKEYGVSESWTKVFVIGPYQVMRSLISWKDGEWLLVESNYGQLATCALHTDEFKGYEIHGVAKTLRSVIYKESLIRLNRVE